MKPVPLTPDVWQLPFPVGHVHCVRLPDGFALVDTGLPGSAEAVLAGLQRLGARPGDVQEIVLTHSHLDHMGAAADLAEATGARVLAGRADAPVIRGDAPEPPPDPTDAERALHEQVLTGLAAGGTPPLRHVAVDRALDDGDVLAGWGQDARVLHVPGHTAGSVAVHLPAAGVLFTGDLVATAEGRAILGPLNVDREQAVASFRRLAALDHVETVCVPHGEPLPREGAAALRAATPEADWL